MQNLYYLLVMQYQVIKKNLINYAQAQSIFDKYEMGKLLGLSLKLSSKKLKNINKQEKLIILQILYVCKKLNDLISNKFKLLNDKTNKSYMSYASQMAEIFEHIINNKTRKDQLYLKWKYSIMDKCCSNCKEKNKKLMKCKKCKNVLFCSKLCQKKYWKLGHSKECR